MIYQFFITIKLYRLRLALGTFVVALLEVPAIGSGVLRMGLVTDVRPE